MESLGIEHQTIPMDINGSGEDTKEAARILSGAVDLLLFSGGDGTAKDVMDGSSGQVPVLGIPAGVKMHSGVFAASPEAAGRVLDAFLRGEGSMETTEVIDIDEDAFREGVLQTRLHGYLQSPALPELMPGSKGPSQGDDGDQRQEIGQSVVNSMEGGVLYLIGPGSTAKACMEVLGLEHSILGVDAVMDGDLIATDLSAKEIEELANQSRKTMIVLGVIGGQGFILGRGNQQFTPLILRQVGKEGITVLCTPSKLSKLKVLRVDSGDPSLDEEFRGRIRVLVGYRRERIVEVV